MKPVTGLLLHLFCLGCALPVTAQITPNGLGTQVERNGTVTTITGGKRGGNNLFHSFGQFNVNTGETANFITNSGIQNILARINGGSVSYINGLIQVLGGSSNLYLMNPAGIVFGAQAQLNVPAAFVATTARQVQFPGGTFGMDTVNVENLTGNPTALLDFGNGSIKVEGSKLNAPGGIALLAGQGGLTVEGATITTDNGVTLTSRGNGFVEVRTKGNILGFEVRQDELAKATSIYQLPELLTGDGRITTNNSTITAQNAQLLGHEVVVQNTTIDVSKAGGGGTVHIGGDLQGKGSRPNAQNVFVDKNSVIKADAIGTGDGGQVIVWADNITGFAGTISAKGGEINGNGGFVEISGRNAFSFTGKVDLTAPNGNTGTLLLDPTNITISNNPTTAITFSSGVFNNALTGANININDLLTNLALSNITVTTTSLLTEDGTITIQDGFSFSNTTPRTLTLLANKDIVLNSGVNITGNNLSLQFNADNSIKLNNNSINLNGTGNVSLQAGNSIDITGGSIDTQTGNVSLKATNPSAIINQGATITSPNGAVSVEASNLNGTINSNGTINAKNNVELFANLVLKVNKSIDSSDGQIKLTANNVFINGTVTTLIDDIVINAPNKITLSSSGFLTSNIGGNILLGTTKELALQGVSINQITTTGSGKIAGNILYIHGDNSGLATQAGDVLINNILPTPIAALPDGIRIENIKIASNSGNISIKGKGLDNVTNAHGINLDNVILDTGFSGTITLIGTGGSNAIADAYGIKLSNSQLSSDSGSISLAGTGGSNAGGNGYGIGSQNTSILSDNGIITLQASGSNQNYNTDSATFLNSGNAVNIIGAAAKPSILSGDIDSPNVLIKNTVSGATTLIDATIDANTVTIDNLSVTDTASSAITATTLNVDNGNASLVNGTHNVSKLGSSNAGAIKLVNNIDLTLQNNNASLLEVKNNGNIDQQPATLVQANSGSFDANGFNVTIDNADFNNLGVQASNLIVKDSSGFTIANVGGINGIDALTATIETSGVINQTAPIEANQLIISDNFGSFFLLHPNNKIGLITGSFNQLNYSSGEVQPLTLNQLSGNIATITTIDQVDISGINALATNFTINTNKEITQAGDIISGGNLNWLGQKIQQTAGQINVASANLTTTTAGDAVINTTGTTTIGTSQVGGDLIVTGNILSQGGSIAVGGKVDINATVSASFPNITATDVTIKDFGNLTIRKIGTVNVGSISAYGDVVIESLSSGLGFLPNSSGTPSITLNQAGNSFGTIQLTTPIGSPTTITGTSEIVAGGVTAQNINLKADTITTGNLNAANDLIVKAQGNITTNNLTGSNIEVEAGSKLKISGFVTGIDVKLTGNRVEVQGVDGNGNSIDASSLILKHGGDGLVPFIVGGNTTDNGTAGQIASGGVPAGSYLFPFSAGNFSILTNAVTPSPPPPPTPSTPQPNTPPISPVLLGEEDILLRSQWPPLLGVAPPVDFFTILNGLDASFRLAYGMDGMEPQNTIGSIQEMQDVLRQAEEQGKGRTALVYWWFRDGNLTVAVVLPKGIAEQTVFLKTVNINAREVETVIGQFVFAIKDYRQRHTKNYRLPARKLYNWLVTPIEPILEQYQVQTLILVPDENLRTIPYRALWDGKQYLIEKYRLTQIPSINLVNLDLVSRPIKGAMIAMGASDFQGQQPPLPAVPIELEQIAQLTQGQKKLNSDFTSTVFTEAWRRHPGFAFHIATHAEFSPSRSYIQFFDGQKPLNLLRENLLANPAELVVLSACRTAIGSPYAELGFSGMAVRLGAKRAIGSLWYVEDESTFALMHDFYRRLTNGEALPITAEALRQTQIDMIRGTIRIENKSLIGNGYRLPLPANLRQDNADFTHPFYWAAFNLLGNPW